ncbi:hypothetical protein [Novosphingobium sp. 9]|uniref:hypothetical protein n=1 Tax=Novosphingobium sp. 9 TaxID=2025349 RepID=UPI0021B60F2C|nr:hypothetical protein [Novosphingobium sp. 9]
MKGYLRPTFAAVSLLLATTAPGAILAQTTSESGSNAAANSGSQSQSASSSNPTNVNAPVNQQGNLTSTSASGSNAWSGSTSGSNSDQGQTQGQSQGQQANNAQTQSQGQLATNEQGVAITFNSTTPRTQKVYTNSPVPLAASSSFSSDYCGGTASGGASVAPIGISFGGAGPVFDKSCQSLRRAEKFGMAAANASNLGQAELAGRLMSMMIWSICTADSSGPKGDKATARACDALGLLGSMGSSQPASAPAPEPAVRGPDGHPTAEAATRQPPMAALDPKLEMIAK